MDNDTTRLSLSLLETSKKCEGCSGRALRKLPFLAHAFYVQVSVVEKNKENWFGL